MILLQGLLYNPMISMITTTSTTLLPDICKFATKYLLNPYGIYTSMVSTTDYNFAARYLWIPMTSTTLYDNYGLYRNFQSLLMNISLMVLKLEVIV
jgi:hypothetical protein